MISKKIQFLFGKQTTDIYNVYRVGANAMTPYYDNIVSALNARRRALGMSVRLLAERCGLGTCTVQRALAGKRNERIKTLLTIASALGMMVALRSVVYPETMRQKAAKEKARRIVARAQGSFALEGQAVLPEKKRTIEVEVRNRLLKSDIRLWSRDGR
jgi:transcriptional regulator with XRE-family HTH domain